VEEALAFVAAPHPSGPPSPAASLLRSPPPVSEASRSGQKSQSRVSPPPPLTPRKLAAAMDDALHTTHGGKVRGRGGERERERERERETERQRERERERETKTERGSWWAHTGGGNALAFKPPLNCDQVVP
jgi:hypothetical protein